MTSRLSIDDLTLVEAVARHGSIGAAATEMLTTQPSASRRLAAVERRLGIPLFERDTTGARPTPAGLEFARQAARLIADIDALPERVTSATRSASLSVGTIQALAPMVFTALEIELHETMIHPEVDHGPVLIQRVHDGTLDVAIVTIAKQMIVPLGLQRTVLGTSPLVLVLPSGTASLGPGRRPLHGRTVFYSTIDLAGEPVRQKLSTLGAIPRLGPTIESTLRFARHHRAPALVPELAARWYAEPGDRIHPSPVPGQITASVITRPPHPASLIAATPRIATRVLGTTTNI